MIIKNHFHKKGFALGLILKQRLAASRKWPVEIIFSLKISDQKTDTTVNGWNPRATVDRVV